MRGAMQNKIWTFIYPVFPPPSSSIPIDSIAGWVQNPRGRSLEGGEGIVGRRRRIVKRKLDFTRYTKMSPTFFARNRKRGKFKWIHAYFCHLLSRFSVRRNARIYGWDKRQHFGYHHSYLKPWKSLNGWHFFMSNTFLPLFGLSKYLFTQKALIEYNLIPKKKNAKYSKAMRVR